MNKKMIEYIKKEDALNASKIIYIEYLEEDNNNYIDADADFIPVVFKKDIEMIPAADVVEVVRCKDCKYNNHCMTQNFMEDCGIIPLDRNTFFCADGKREKDDG